MSARKLTAKVAHTVPVLRKAVRVIEALAQNHGHATTKSLAADLRISPTTCYRILQSFVADGWLLPRPGGTFVLSFGLVSLLRPLLQHELLIEMVREPLAQLARSTGLTAKLSVRQGNDAVTIHIAPSPRPTAITSRLGGIFTLAIGSSGAVFLSELDDKVIAKILSAAPAEAWKFQERPNVIRRVREARKQGICSDNGSYQSHVHTLSAPLHARDKELVGVITLMGFPQDFAGRAKTDLVQKLRHTVGRCNELIQGRGPVSIP